MEQTSGKVLVFWEDSLNNGEEKESGVYFIGGRPIIQSRRELTWMTGISILRRPLDMGNLWARRVHQQVSVFHPGHEEGFSFEPPLTRRETQVMVFRIVERWVEIQPARQPN